MKKYTIKDNLGNKKTIYAEDVAHAMKFADETYNSEYSIQQFKSYVSNIIKDLYGIEYNSNKVRAISELDSYVSQVIDDFKADIKNSNLDKRKTVQYYMQYVNALYKELTNVKNVQNIDGQSLKKIDDIHAKMARSIHDSKLEDVAHAMKFADETYNSEYSIQQFKSYVSNIIKDLYGIEYNSNKVRAISELDSYVSQVIDDFKADIKNSNLDKRKTVQYYMQYVNALYKELTNVKNVQNIDGQSLKKIDDIHAKMARSIHDSKLKDVSLTNGDWFTLRNDYNATIYKIISVSHDVYVTDVYSVEADFGAKKSFIRKIGSKSFYTSNIKGRDNITTLAVKFNSAEEAMNWLKRQNRLTSNLFKQHDSKLKDEASLATTLNALVNDEKAAIDAYDVAIKNLEGKIDEDAKQVLINIRDDERRHIENLYAILNGQVTEKNLEDSKTANEAER